MVGILETKYSSKVRRKVMSGLSCRKYLRSFFSVSIILIPSRVYETVRFPFVCTDPLAREAVGILDLASSINQYIFYCFKVLNDHIYN